MAKKPSFTRFDMRRAAKKGRKAEFRPIRHIADLPDAAFHVKARQTWPLSLPSAALLCHIEQNSAFGTKHPTPSHHGTPFGRLVQLFAFGTGSGELLAKRMKPTLLSPSDILQPTLLGAPPNRSQTQFFGASAERERAGAILGAERQGM